MAIYRRGNKSGLVDVDNEGEHETQFTLKGDLRLTKEASLKTMIGLWAEEEDQGFLVECTTIKVHTPTQTGR